MPPSDKASDPFIELSQNRKEMERTWELRQENILPLENAWNVGRFYGLVLKGGLPFTGLQRIGIFVIGLSGIGIATTFLITGRLFPQYGPSLRSLSASLPDFPLVWLPQLLLYVLLGLRFCWVALKPFRSRD